jgi:hypothetical protein
VTTVMQDGQHDDSPVLGQVVSFSRIAAEAHGPVLGQVVIGMTDSARVVRWTSDSADSSRGLTLRGMAAAAVATGRYLASIDLRLVTLAARAGSRAEMPQVRITPHTWEIAFLPGQESITEAIMTDVVNAHGSIGVLA